MAQAQHNVDIATEPGRVYPRTSVLDSALATQHRADALNLALLLVGFLLVLVLVPPVRSFPVTDDWTCTRSVTGFLQGAYRPHDAVQATAVGHIAWGALFALIFGQSFTVLSIANLITAALGTVVLYLLL